MNYLFIVIMLFTPMIALVIFVVAKTIIGYYLHVSFTESYSERWANGRYIDFINAYNKRKWRKNTSLEMMSSEVDDSYISKHKIEFDEVNMMLGFIDFIRFSNFYNGEMNKKINHKWS